ncbi:MAG: hypothetical protein DRI22_00960 [Caldiserica bacterium]|nr:MAG: hypothetical protein DRI22_00960 [Caldisericota bacterium]
MIERWSIVFVPTADYPLRYKIKIKSDSDTFKKVLEKFKENIIGRPFSPTDKDYNFAFYVVLEDEDKERLIDLLRGIEKEEKKEEIMEEKVEKKERFEVVKKVFEEAKLNPEYTFENFVVGKGNRFPYSACLQVVDSLGKVYNPLFIWGGVGLGKTHLLHAIGNKVLKENPSKRIFYVSTPDFIQEVVDGIRSGTQKELIAKYTLLDLFLIDDIQFLKGEGAEEIFFRIFEKLYNSGKQIVITSDRPPKEIDGITDRIRSRFEWGLITGIEKPDIHTRVAILKKKLERAKFDVSDEILFYAAEKLSRSVRELVGFINRLYAYYQIKGEISIEDVKEMFGEKEEREEKGEEEKKEIPPPPPPENLPPPPPEIECPYCGGPIEYIEEYDRYYCFRCRRYAPPDFGKGKWGVRQKIKKKEEQIDLKVLKELEELTKPPEKPTVEIEEVKEVEKKMEEEKEEKEEKEETFEKKVVKGKRRILRKIPVGLFYPEGREQCRNIVLEYFSNAIEKYKLHFELEYQFINEYFPDEKMNFKLLVEMCKTSKVNIAIVVGPTPEDRVNESNFCERLKQTFNEEGMCLEYISYKEMKQTFNYLNYLLDIANFGHQKLGIQKLREIF